MRLWYRHGLMVLATPMVLTQNHVIVMILLNQTHTRGLSVARMRDFFWMVWFADVLTAQATAPPTPTLR